MTSRRLVGLSIALWVCCAAAEVASATGPPIVEDIAHLGMDTAYLVERGRLEVDLTHATGRREGGQDRLSEVGMEVEYGVGERLMLELEVVYADDEPAGEAGLDGWEALAKTRLFARGSWTSALSLGVEGDTSSGAVAAPVAFLVSFSPADGKTAWHLELGGEWEEGDGVEGPFLGLALDRALSPDVAVQLAFHGSQAEGEFVAAAGPGLRAELELESASIDEIELVAGVLARLAGDASDWWVVVGIELEF